MYQVFSSRPLSSLFQSQSQLWRRSWREKEEGMAAVVSRRADVARGHRARVPSIMWRERNRTAIHSSSRQTGERDGGILLEHVGPASPNAVCPRQWQIVLASYKNGHFPGFGREALLVTVVQLPTHWCQPREKEIDLNIHLFGDYPGRAGLGLPPPDYIQARWWRFH